LKLFELVGKMDAMEKYCNANMGNKKKDKREKKKGGVMTVRVAYEINDCFFGGFFFFFFFFFKPF
jgi:hypothetical protein